MANNWDALSTQEQMSQLRVWDNSALAKQFDQQISFFQEIREFFEKLPKTTKQPKLIPHYPPKDLIISARRDLSFYEANFELFDNSIDKWRLGGAKKDLSIEVEYNLDLRKGQYIDDAGGMEEGSVYKVFIPGETTNDDFDKPVIGSFGMGAKKAIFRLSDGAKVISCTSTKFSATSEVPEKWEVTPNWETLDGRAEAIKLGATEIYLFKLFDPPTASEIDELIKRTGATYRPLIDGTLLDKKVRITVNGTAVPAASQPGWSAPNGAEPRLYKFGRSFRNFLDTGNDIQLNFRMKCGLTRKLPGSGVGADTDWGVDVYGNGRLIERFLKEEFGFGTAGMSKNTQGSKYFRAELFIDGHSFAIPWDTHKREYLADHIVSRWIRERARPIVKAYVTVAGSFASATDLRSTVLATSKPSGTAKTYKIGESEPPAASSLPKWTYGPRPGNKGKKKAQGKSKPDANGDEDSSSVDVGLRLDKADYGDLLQRFASSDEQELSAAIIDCLFGGVIFPLKAKEFESALSLLKCDDATELSDEIRRQLVSRLRKRK